MAGFGQGGIEVEAYAVVFKRQRDPPILSFQVEIDQLGLGVSRDIVQSLLDDAEDDDF